MITLKATKYFILSTAVMLFVFFTYSNNLNAKDKHQETMSINDLYDVMPDIPSCKAGTLKQTEKQKILDKVNMVRALHGLRPVSYAPSFDNQTAQAALIIGANTALNHYPPASYSCYSKDGYDGSGSSNLHINLYSNQSMAPTSESCIRSFMVDSNVKPLGHRRAIINPFLKYISFGRCDGQSKQYSNWYLTGMALKVYFSEEQDATNMTKDYVAYPEGNYPPEMFGKTEYLSFTVICDKTDLWGNDKVDFKNATIEIKDANNNVIKADSIAYDNDGAGVPNCLKWRCKGLQEEMKYNVTIKTVSVNGTNKDFTYWFKLTNTPSTPPTSPVLAAPPNKADTVNTNTVLKWNASGTAKYYHVQVSTSNTFGSFFLNKDTINSTTLTVNNLVDKTTYYWRVKAVNDAGESSYSEIWQFTTKVQPTAGPLLTLPENSATNVALTPTFKWNRITNATSYRLVISTNPDFSPITKDVKPLADTFYVYQGTLDKNTKYYWHVSATLGNGSTSLWSDARSFTTTNISYVDNGTSQDGLVSIFSYPNPVDKAATFNIKLAIPAEISLKIYNNSGQEAATVLSGFYEIGNYDIVFDTGNLSSGNYFYKLNASGRQVTGKFTIVR